MSPLISVPVTHDDVRQELIKLEEYQVKECRALWRRHH